jgi:hypothetical protein
VKLGNNRIQINSKTYLKIYAVSVHCQINRVCARIVMWSQERLLVGAISDDEHELHVDRLKIIIIVLISSQNVVVFNSTPCIGQVSCHRTEQTNRHPQSIKGIEMCAGDK